MTTREEIQALLRFLSQDAKIPLPIAMKSIKDLQNADLTSPASFASTSITKIQSIFPDSKQAKAVLQAAKRFSSPSRKRPSSSTTTTPSPKRPKSFPVEDSQYETPAAIEASLAFPSPPWNVIEKTLPAVVLLTNRAPLHLAFAVQTLKYTHPEQPLSSRLSLAQAVVSANAKSKAQAIGIKPKKGHEGGFEEEIGRGQPRVRVMGREIPVLKRWGYDPTEGETKAEDAEIKTEAFEKDTQSTLKGDDDEIKYPDLSGRTDINPSNHPSATTHHNEEPPLWGLDLSSPNSRSKIDANPNLPIHQPAAARAYLLKSFQRIPGPDAPLKKITAKQAALDKEQDCTLLLHTIDLLLESWAKVLSREDLDRRAWGWYVAVRPEVKPGEAGWGQKGEVRLGDILELRRKG